MEILGALFRAVLAGPFQLRACADFRFAFFPLYVVTQALPERPKIIG